jgi:hypothetical protein
LSRVRRASSLSSRGLCHGVGFVQEHDSIWGPADAQHLGVGVDHEVGLEGRIDSELVVVSGHDVAADVFVGEAVFGKGDPASDFVDHQLTEHRLAIGLVFVQALVFGLLAAVWVEAVEPDSFLQLVKLVGGRHRFDLAEHACLVAAVACGDDGHHDLAGNVATHDQGVDVVEGRRV